MKKFKFLLVKKKAIVAILFCILAVGCAVGAYYAARATASPKPVHTIVIDAGHGGKDGGAVGKQTGVTESYLNLEYAKTLQKLCKEYGFKVVMTRSDMNGLYSESAKNKKKSEMEKRKKIIKKSKADLLVSIHINSFPSSSARGCQVFFAQGNENGKVLAESVSLVLNENIEHAKKTAKVGDYFVLNCTSKPAILVECGFLSNAEEEMLLQDNEYENKLCYQILCGILQFFKM